MKRILLLGRSGSGKSTVATMLYKRTIDADNSDFTISSAPVGVTVDKNVRQSKDRKWEIYDTVGLGEPAGGTVPNEEAKRKLIELLKTVNTGFDYICLLKGKDRFDVVDKQVLTFVYTLFGYKNIQTNMFYIISIKNEDDEDWISKNLIDLNKYMDTRKAITACFPEYNDEDSYQKKLAKEETRARSLHKLESLLQNTKTVPVYPRTTNYTDYDYREFVISLYSILDKAGKIALESKNDILKLVNNMVDSIVDAQKKPPKFIKCCFTPQVQR